MYLPKHFENPDRDLALQVMREYGFALLVCADDDSGWPGICGLALAPIAR